MYLFEVIRMLTSLMNFDITSRGQLTGDEWAYADNVGIHIWDKNGLEQKFIIFYKVLQEMRLKPQQ